MRCARVVRYVTVLDLSHTFSARLAQMLTLTAPIDRQQARLGNCLKFPAAA
jgi:hypothetical protein